MLTKLGEKWRNKEFQQKSLKKIANPRIQNIIIQMKNTLEGEKGRLDDTKEYKR